MSDPITPLHVRSGYSLLRGTSPVEKLLERARRLGHERLALTDVNNLCAATKFYRLAQQAHLRPLLGAELRDGPHAVVALVGGEVGYENLCRVITRVHGRRPEPPEPAGSDLPADLAELGEGLELIVEDAPTAAALLAAGAKPKRLWLGIDPPTQSPSRLRRLIECGERLSLPLAATGKALFTEPDEHEVARLLTAIRLGSTYQDLSADALPPREAWLRGPAELQAQLAAFPEAVANNRRLAERCRCRLLPRKPVFPDFAPPEGLSAHAYLRRLCRDGMRRRYGPLPSDAAECRLERELRLIRRLGFSEYFLVVWDIVRHARESGGPVAGRGSGASSLVAYVLGITNVCPLKFQIPFERFLHEGREDFPDLDVDFCWRVRDDVIEYAFRRWGEEHVAMVSTHNTFQPRSALRETAKAFGLADAQISRLMEGDPRAEPRMRRIGQLARRLIELPHNLSVHPGGIVIGRKPIDHYVPIQPAPKGVNVTQYDKDGVKDIRLVKLDLLGNRCLSTVRGACELIRRRRGRRIDVESLPPADAATIRSLCAADTVGCNQLESPAMRALLKMMQPKDTPDVMKALALIRPGAASIGMKEVFLRRRRGLEAVPRGCPHVDGLLRETHGVMLYEDDVMLVAAALLGGPLSEADRFRKAVQKCPDDDARLKLSREFLARCRANGVPAEYAKDLWVQMAKFNAYSFCRAHAASYALLAYAGAYLKTHYPLEYWVAALNNNQSMYPPRVYVEQAKRDGIRFVLPDANRSGEEFRPDRESIRVGLNFVAGLGPAGIEAILRSRQRGPFGSLSEFLARTHLGREQARGLVLCGAFDFTGRKRPELMMEMDVFFGAGAGRARLAGTLLPARPELPDVPNDYSPRRKARDEWRILGISVGRHVLEHYRRQLAGATDADSRDLPGRVGRRVRIAGMLEAQRATPTRAGKTMLFLTLDDEYGLFEVTVFPDACRKIPPIRRHGPYVVTGKVEQQYGAVTVSAESIRLHRAAPAKAAP